MTKLIAALIIVVVLYAGWHLFLYWEQVKNEEENTKKQEAAARVVGDQLPGLPDNVDRSLRAAQQASQQQGAAALRNWLKAFDKQVLDPRKAWIELDYCVLVAREDPAEARRVFAAVKQRIPPSSPVWPRI